MRTIVRRVSNACAQGTRWRAIRPNEKIGRLKPQKRRRKNQPGVAHFYGGKAAQFFGVANNASSSDVSASSSGINAESFRLKGKRRAGVLSAPAGIAKH
jgi:hypothetical protein